MKEIISVIITIISGVGVFIIGEILKETWLDPLRQYHKIKHDILFALVYYANVYTSVIDCAESNKKIFEIYDLASKEFRRLASETESFVGSLYVFKLGIPKKKLEQCVSRLIGLSNGLYGAHNINDYDYMNRRNREVANGIRELLRADHNK